MGNRLTTTRYTVPGVYIGQIIRPSGGTLSSEARICNYIGQGSRLAMGKNLGMRRSFVFEEELSFPISAPFESVVDFPSDGTKSAPVRVYDSITGVELLEKDWAWGKVGADIKKVIISQSIYEPTAVYKIDYQSTSREVKDPLPIDNLRVISAVGLSIDRSQYVDFVDFYIPYAFTGATSNPTNFLDYSFLTTLFPDFGNIGGGVVTMDAASSYNHDYNRFYELEVMSITGLSGSFEATFRWSSRIYSGGRNALPPTPLHISAIHPSFTAEEANSLTLIQELELGIKVDIAFTGTNFSVGDKFYFNGVGPGLIEFDGRLTNPNQYLSFGLISYSGPGTGTGSLNYSPDNAYTGTFNTKFRLQVTATAGAFGSRTVTFVWAEYGELIRPNSTVLVDETVSNIFTLTQGVELEVDFGASHFAVDDVYDFMVKAPRIYYQAKDDRAYDIGITAVSNPGADTGTIAGTYATGTPEGAFGDWSAAFNLLLDPAQETGYFELPDGVRFAARNGIQGNINGSSYAPGDKFDAAVTSEDIIDWSLVWQVEELREPSVLLTDVTGMVTGTAGTLYTILENVYATGSVVAIDNVTSVPISFIELPGTRFLAILSLPLHTIKISYDYRGAEPSPGQLYYFSASYLRPTAVYNVPTRLLSRDDATLFLAPSLISNHLYIMAQMAFDIGAPGIYVTQPFDNDGDGVITDTDVAESLQAHAKVKRITDLCLLSLFGSLADSLSANQLANDPFEAREQMLWVGTPIGTPIGDVDTLGSLVALSRRVLQTNPTSPAIGTRVLVAPTKATRQIKLENGNTAIITLDGSFVAGATSALVNSFADPAETILRKTLNVFKTMQTYSDPENLILGQNSITWLQNEGNGVFRFMEDVTVSDNAEEFQLISATTQKQFVTRLVRTNMDQALISVVVPSAEAGVATVKSVLSGIMLGLLGRGLIGQYQDESGAARDFDPDADILVLRDTSSLTLYNFFYSYYLRTPIKRLFGLFIVNTNDFGA